MGWDSTTAALLLKGSLCAAPSPSSCLRVVSRVGRQLGIEWLVAVVVGGLVVVQTRLCPSAASFCRLRRGKRAGQLWAMPS